MTAVVWFAVALVALTVGVAWNALVRAERELLSELRDELDAERATTARLRRLLDAEQACPVHGCDLTCPQCARERPASYREPSPPPSASAEPLRAPHGQLAAVFGGTAALLHALAMQRRRRALRPVCDACGQAYPHDLREQHGLTLCRRCAGRRADA